MRIGLSKAHGSEKYQNYIQWLHAGKPEIEWVDLYVADDVARELELMDALVLTGGGDINPVLYNHPEYTQLCTNIDDKRDALEYAALQRALEREIPVLGICRGLQLINVYHGGTLIPHIPAKLGPAEIHTSKEEKDSYHTVEITPGTLLYKAVRELGGEVNSSHHQAVDQLGEDLMATAIAEEGTIEAIEWKNLMGRSYMIAVQWHPERMSGEGKYFSDAILEQFLHEAASSKILANVTKPLPKDNTEPIDPPTGTASNGSGLFPIINT